VTPADPVVPQSPRPATTFWEGFRRGFILGNVVGLPIVAVILVIVWLFR